MVILSPLGGISPSLGIKLIVALGISNLLFLILTWATCRCRLRWISKMKPGSNYEKFFRMHCFFWKCLVTSVIIHIIIVLMTFGIPLP